MKNLLITLFISFFILSGCKDSKIEIGLLSSKNSSHEEYFSKLNSEYELDNYELKISLINNEMKEKYPHVTYECSYIKDNNPTKGLCQNLSPKLSIDSTGLLSWNTTHAENGIYTFYLETIIANKKEVKVFSIHVNNNNRVPTIEVIADQTRKGEVAFLDINFGQASADLDGDALGYDCFFDMVVDQTVLHANECSNLSGLTFSKTTGLFSWTPSFSQEGVYEFKINVSDGISTSSRLFTLTVLGKDPFISEWQTTTANESIQLPLSAGSSVPYDLKVDWGDGSAIETISSLAEAQHIYEEAGIYQIRVKGNYPVMTMVNLSSSMKKKLLRVLDLGDIGLTSLQEAFSGAENLISIKGGNVSSVTNMNSMFNGAYSLVEVDVSTWDTSNVTSMNAMFWNALALENLDLSHLNTSKVTDMSAMFYQCSKLKTLDISGFNTSNVVDMSNMFAFNRALEAIDVSHFDTSKVTSLRSMFLYAQKIKSLNLENFVTDKVTDMSFMFSTTSELEDLNINNFNTANVTNMASMFSGTLRLSNYSVASFNTAKVTSMSYMFNRNARTTLDLSHFNTSEVTLMDKMFSSMTRLTQLNISSFNTSKVTNMSDMFESTLALENLDVSSFNTSNVTSMSYMFSSMQKVKSLNLSHFNTSKVTTMASMFNYTNELESLNISNFDTSKVTDMRSMFYSTNLISLDLSKFNTTSVTNMSRMFGGSSSFENLLLYGQNSGIYSWDISNVTDSTSIFSGVLSNAKIYCDQDLGSAAFGSIFGKTCIDPASAPAF